MDTRLRMFTISSMRIALIALLLAACGGTDDPANGDPPCSDFEGSVEFVMPEQWCQLTLTGEDGTGGLYKFDLGQIEHSPIAVSPLDMNGQMVGADVLKGADGKWYVQTETWPGSTMLGVALHTGKLDANGQAPQVCRFFVCDASVTVRPAEAPHPW